MARSQSTLLLPLLAALLPAQQVQAAEKSQADLVTLRAAKLQKPVFRKAPWLTDYDQARGESQRTGKPIFCYFTRSYTPCTPCEQFENSVLSEPAFAEFARSVVLFVHNTSRVSDEPQPDLLLKKGFTGWPSMAFLDADGRVIGKPAERSVASLVAMAARLKVWKELKARGSDGGDEVARRLFVLEVELDQHGLPAIRQALQQQKFSPEQVAVLDGRLVDAELRTLLDAARQTGPEPLAAAVAALAKAGRRPSPGNSDSCLQFWSQAIAHAARTRDQELAQQAYDELQKLTVSPSTRNRFARLLAQAKGESRPEKQLEKQPEKPIDKHLDKPRDK